MSKPIATLAGAVAVVMLVLSAQDAQCQVLYQNTTTFQGGDFNIANGEVGNEITLTGTAASYFITDFSFQFDFISTSGSGGPSGTEMGDVRFYQNDGPPANPGGPSPGTVLYDSGPFFIGGYSPASVATFANPAQFGQAIIVPQTFTWTVSFSGVQGNETAGLGLYYPPAVGTNNGDVWISDGLYWEFEGSSGNAPPPVFGAEADGVPVPELRFSVKNNLLRLSWPALGGFFLQSTTNLTNPSSWVSVPGAVVIDKEHVVTESIAGPAKYYRLSLLVPL